MPSESRPASTRLTIDVPYYVHPEALEIGRVILDPTSATPERRLTVVGVEPALIVVDETGERSSVLAHLVEVIE